MSIVFQPAHHAVVGDVAEHQKSTVAEIHWPLGPTKPGGDALDGRVALPVDETRIKPFDARIGITGVRQIAERQGHSFLLVSQETCCPAHRLHVTLHRSIHRSKPGCGGGTSRKQLSNAIWECARCSINPLPTSSPTSSPATRHGWARVFVTF